MQFTELHFHLLPGVDDGPRSVDESVALARQARGEGTRTIVATPHVRPEWITDPADLPERAAEVRRGLRAAGVGVEVRVGAELGHEMVPRLTDEELTGIALGPAGARFVLMEAPFFGPAEDFHEAAEELRARGFGVLVAHPERSEGLTWDSEAGLMLELRRGSRLQVNAGSLLGEHGPGALRAGRRIVGAGLASALASDAHGAHRPPLLQRGVAAARECGLPPGSARRLVGAGPASLLRRGIPGPRVPVAA